MNVDGMTGSSELKKKIENSVEGQHDDLTDISADIFSEIFCEDIGVSDELPYEPATSIDDDTGEITQVEPTSCETAPVEQMAGETENCTELKLICEVISTNLPIEKEVDNVTAKNGGQSGLNFKEGLNIEGQVEALVFAAPKPIKANELLEILQIEIPECTLARVEAVLKTLMKLYDERRGGFTLEYIRGEGYQFRTVECVAPLMERLFASRPRPLSRAAFETLAVIAYRQPVTRADIEYIRGVDAGSIIKNLLERNLIQCVGRKEDAGRPMLFGTTGEFLRVFRITALGDLPPLSSFQPSAEVIKTANEMIERVSSIDVEQFMASADDNESDMLSSQPQVGDDDISAEQAQQRTGAVTKKHRSSVVVTSAQDSEIPQPADDF